MGDPFFYSYGAVYPRAATGGGEHGRPLVVDGEAVPGRRSVCPPRDQGLASAGGRYPSRHEHLSTSSCDASLLVDIVSGWDAGWQVAYVVMRIAARGLYSHPDVQNMIVQGERIISHVDEILQFVNRWGYALGLLEREVCGPYEAPWDREEPHPLVELHAMTEELDAMARVVVEQLMDKV
jgi:hypothetical protein